VMRRLRPLLARDAIVMMDDIQDNLYFRDYVEGRDAGCEIVDYDGKYLGIVGIAGIVGQSGR
jgi:hypothetical protein